MPRRKKENKGNHKTTISLPREIHEDLCLLAPLDNEGTITALIEKAIRKMLEAEKETIQTLRELREKRRKWQKVI